MVHGGCGRDSVADVEVMGLPAGTGALAGRGRSGAAVAAAAGGPDQVFAGSDRGPEEEDGEMRAGETGDADRSAVGAAE